MPNSRLILAATLALPLLAGCGGGGKLASVRGKFSYKNAPLPAGTIVFSPDENRGNTGPLARADIQPDGSYSLRTGEAPGAAAGWYRVTVVALEAAPSAPADAGAGFG